MVRTGLLRFVPAATLMAVAVVLAPAADAANTGVAIAGFAFSPQTVTIHVGDSVTWSNSDPRTHTATADDGSFDTGAIGSGASKTVTFSTAGTFAYHCSIHPSMTASIIVEAAAVPATDTAPVVAPADRTPLAAVLVVVFAAALAASGLALARRRDRTGRPTR